ncbi:MAG TPA: sugar transferase [Bacillota bacterium]|nr:sugar transferase [Bacillota bacterium]
MYRNFIKRALDVAFALAALPFLAVAAIFVCPAIWLEDGGPAFYNAGRLGKGGRVFRMLKFRTMRTNSPDIRNEDGSTFSSESDPRLTRIGKILRKTSIDELPQILNVLTGDMSIIGPRPDLPEHYELYSEQEKRKLEARPGMTGYNQAYFRNSIKWKDRIANDIYYIDNMSFLMDLRIALKTVGSVLYGRSVYTDGGAEGQGGEPAHGKARKRDIN